MLITSSSGFCERKTESVKVIEKIDSACPECGENRANCKTRGGPIEGIDIIPLAGNKGDVTELEIGLIKMLFEKAQLDFLHDKRNIEGNELEKEYKQYLQKQVSDLHAKNVKKVKLFNQDQQKSLKNLQAK